MPATKGKSKKKKIVKRLIASGLEREEARKRAKALLEAKRQEQRDKRRERMASAIEQAAERGRLRRARTLLKRAKRGMSAEEIERLRGLLRQDAEQEPGSQVPRKIRRLLRVFRRTRGRGRKIRVAKRIMRAFRALGRPAPAEIVEELRSGIAAGGEAEGPAAPGVSEEERPPSESVPIPSDAPPSLREFLQSLDDVDALLPKKARRRGRRALKVVVKKLVQGDILKGKAKKAGRDILARKALGEGSIFSPVRLRADDEATIRGVYPALPGGEVTRLGKRAALGEGAVSAGKGFRVVEPGALAAFGGGTVLPMITPGGAPGEGLSPELVDALLAMPEVPVAPETGPGAYVPEDFEPQAGATSTYPIAPAPDFIVEGEPLDESSLEALLAGEPVLAADPNLVDASALPDFPPAPVFQWSESVYGLPVGDPYFVDDFGPEFSDPLAGAEWSDMDLDPDALDVAPPTEGLGGEEDFGDLTEEDLVELIAALEDAIRAGEAATADMSAGLEGSDDRMRDLVKRSKEALSHARSLMSSYRARLEGGLAGPADAITLAVRSWGSLVLSLGSLLLLGGLAYGSQRAISETGQGLKWMIGVAGTALLVMWGAREMGLLPARQG